MTPIDGNIFATDRIRLRGVEETDFEYFFKWELDSESARMDDEIWYPTSSASRREWVQSQTKLTGADDEFRFTIVTHDNIVLGTLNTHTINRRCGTFMYGVYIAPEQRKKGYASEAIKLTLRYYFHERRYQKVNAEVYAFNAASIQLHEQFGFMLEGRLRRMVYTNGAYHDALIYGMTREEFEAKYT